MGMTREEAIKVLKNGGIEVCGEADRISEFIAALDVALDALIPPTRENELEAENRELKERIVNWRKYMAPTREQVEKAWMGEWILDEDDGKYQCDNCKIKFPVNYNFCPYCGGAKTEKAMQKVIGKLESLEEMKNG